MENRPPRVTGELVDNRAPQRTVLRHLREWCGQGGTLDVATGPFEIGAILALEGAWRRLDKMRILVGDGVSSGMCDDPLEPSRSTMLEVLDRSVENRKAVCPLLLDVRPVLDALRTRQIECRAYDGEPFHARAYIAHAGADGLDAGAMLGSSGFNPQGLTGNVELNLTLREGPEVAEVRGWFTDHWARARDVTVEVIDTLSRQVHPFTPFDVYAKALYEFFRGRELTASEWDKSRSSIFPKLDRYQKEAYWAMMKIALRNGGAFLCDGVGLGKTFVGLMLIERLVRHEGKRVVLFAPKAVREAVWEPHLREWLPDIGGAGGNADFSNLAVFSHSDLGRRAEFPERFERIASMADAVVIDEAHHFRNGKGQQYGRLFDLLDGSERAKMAFLLTATPINNGLSDFRHMAELFTRREESRLAASTGVHNLRSHFKQMEKRLQRALGHEDAGIEGHDAMEELSMDRVFREMVVQRSRAYARRSQELEHGRAAVFPDRRPPKVVEYSLRKTFGRLLEELGEAFQRENPLFSLAAYYPLAWYRGSEGKVDPFAKNRQKQVVALIRTHFLKRFESSVVAFEISCGRLMNKLLDFLQVNCEGDEKARLDRWKECHKDQAAQPLEEDEEEAGEAEDDVVPQELVDGVEHLDRQEYDVPGIVRETFADLDRIATFLTETRGIQPDRDDKLQRLIRLLRSSELDGQKVLIFSEFADTARYLHRELCNAGIHDVAQVDSTTKADRREIIRRFAPYYNPGEPTQEKTKTDHARRVADKIRNTFLAHRPGKEIDYPSWVATCSKAESWNKAKAQGMVRAALKLLDDLQEVEVVWADRQNAGWGTKSARLSYATMPAAIHAKLKAARQEEQEEAETPCGDIRILISTDVLSEGLNLQDASRLINYDIHWNPVRLMQRIGRVDRRLNQQVEDKICADHPEIAASRGKVTIWNFLPPRELDDMLALYKRVAHKTLLISKTFGIEDKKLLKPDDDYDALKEFNRSYEGTQTDIEKMRLAYQELLDVDPALEDRLRGLPTTVLSARQRVAQGCRGVFFCYAFPAVDSAKSPPGFKRENEDALSTRWFLYDLDRNTILEDTDDLKGIVDAIRSDTNTPPVHLPEARALLDIESKALLDVRARVESHIRRKHLGGLDTSGGARPILKCWMELKDC